MSNRGPLVRNDYRGGTVYIHAVNFENKAQAQDWADHYAGRYPSFGYGTHLNVQQAENGEWVVNGYRQTSCD